MQYLVDIHYIIPQQYRYHPTLLYTDYNVDKGYNFIFLPTLKGAEELYIHNDRPIHLYGHLKYNRFVEEVLDMMFLEQYVSEDSVCKLNLYLRSNMRHLNIPWI
tara:strand:+ start:208 stop:519 length:312 start_codon:yes stop_codon:yes gene_type:complete